MLIQCPECGHQVSDKAPTCPNCGIEIAGHTTGTTTNQQATQQVTPQAYEEPIVEAQPYDGPVVEAVPYETQEPVATPPQQQPRAPKQRSHTTLWISFFIAAVICAAMLYVYKDATDQLASDKAVNMDKIRNMQEDVDSSLVDPNYKKQETKIEADEPTESTEPAAATEEPADEGEAATHDNSQPTTADMEKATSAVRRFFRAINSHDKEALGNSVSPYLSTFNGKERATKLDVQQYMTDLYQADVKNINWYIGDIKNISKREVGDNRYEYDITLDAKKVTEREGGTATHNYTVRAMVEDDGKLGSITINKK